MVTVRNHKQLFQQRRFRILMMFLIILSLLLGIIIVPIEQRVGMIKTTGDGIWWAVSTVTTVGYGDLVPVTGTGRIIGIILQVLGAMIFGIMVAVIGNYVNRSQDEFYWNRLFERMDRLESQVQELQKRTGYIVKEHVRAASNSGTNLRTGLSQEASPDLKMPAAQAMSDENG